MKPLILNKRFLRLLSHPGSLHSCLRKDGPHVLLLQYGSNSDLALVTPLNGWGAFVGSNPTMTELGHGTPFGT